jgi:hypothetical protein
MTMGSIPTKGVTAPDDTDAAAGMIRAAQVGVGRMFSPALKNTPAVKGIALRVSNTRPGET